MSLGKLRSSVAQILLDVPPHQKGTLEVPVSLTERGKILFSTLAVSRERLALSPNGNSLLLKTYG